MFRFLETIKLKDGVFYRLHYHQERINRCFKFYFEDKSAPNLERFLFNQAIPKLGLYKCRILYDAVGFAAPEFQIYTIKKIHSLKLIETSMKPMVCKSSQREAFNQLHALRGTSDDVLLTRDGYLTDTTYSNIALWNGKDWITPRNPIIYGTNRAYLLEKKLIQEGDIDLDKLSQFTKIRLFNAMIEFGDVELDMLSINKYSSPPLL